MIVPLRSCKHSFWRTHVYNLRRAMLRAFCYPNCNSICDILCCRLVAGIISTKAERTAVLQDATKWRENHGISEKLIAPL